MIEIRTIRWYHHLLPGLAPKIARENAVAKEEQRAIADRWMKACGPIMTGPITAEPIKT